MLVGGPGRWLHPRGHCLRPALSAGKQLPAQQGHRARWLRVAALLRSVGQTQRPSAEFGLLMLNSRLSERPVGCAERHGIEEEQRMHQLRSFGVSFLGLVAYRVLLRTFYVCNGSVCTVPSAVSILGAVSLTYSMDPGQEMNSHGPGGRWLHETLATVLDPVYASHGYVLKN